MRITIRFSHNACKRARCFYPSSSKLQHWWFYQFVIQTFFFAFQKMFLVAWAQNSKAYGTPSAGTSPIQQTSHPIWTNTLKTKRLTYRVVIHHPEKYSVYHCLVHSFHAKTFSTGGRYVVVYGSSFFARCWATEPWFLCWFSRGAKWTFPGFLCVIWRRRIFLWGSI